MSRSAIFFAFFLMLSVRGFAETPHAIASIDPDLTSEREGSLIRVGRPSPQLKEESISIVRLRVPAKARKLFEKSAEALRKHRYSVAQESLTQALQQDPAFPEALTMVGYIQLNLNHWEVAEQNLQAAIRSDPTYGPAYLVFSDLRNREQRFDDALAMAQRGLALLPATWDLQYEIIRALLGKRQYALALKTSEGALHNHRGTLLHVAKAYALIGLRRYPEAAAELRIYLAYQPRGDGSGQAQAFLADMQGKAR